MSVLLHVSASIRTRESHGRRYGNAVVEKIKATRPDLVIKQRDLCLPFLPHLAEPFIGASLKRPDQRSAEDCASLALSEQLIEEVENSDVLVIDFPMHNFTIPSTLKAWIDYIVRPQRTFRSTPNGKIGLLADRLTFCIMACGGPLTEGQAQPDFGSPYLLHVLKTIGIHSVGLFVADNLLRGNIAIDRTDTAFAMWLSSIPTTYNHSRKRE